MEQPGRGTALRLRLPTPAPAVPELDAEQAAAVAWPAGAGHLLVVGAPGTGKTTTAVESFLARAGGTGPDRPGTSGVAGDQGAALLVPTRRGAARVRDAVAARLGRTTTQVLVRTPASFAYSVLRLRAALLHEPPPTLITGPEQDQILAELLDGHRAGLGAPVRWPESISAETLAMGAFRDELRDLFMRAAELGLGPAELAERGERHDRPEWTAAAVLLEEYQEVTALGELTPDRGARLDAARIVDEAAAALLAWEDEVPDHPRPRWSAVVVDDHQDSTLATARLLRVLAEDGAQLLLHGDPDTGVQGFRGGTPALVGRAETRDALGGFDATRHELRTVHRGDAELRATTRAVTAAVSVVGTARHRQATVPAPGTDGASSVDGAPHGLDQAVLRSRAQEGAYVARALREEHLYHGTPWSQMAVVVRSAGHLTALQRSLRSWRVPVSGSAGPGVLREEPAVRPFLVALDAALAGTPDAEQAVELLTSPIGGMDAVNLRTLRRTLRGLERAAGGARPVDELLVQVLADVELAQGLPVGVVRGPARVAGVLAAGRAALDRAGVTAETVLWALWDAAGLSDPWRERALSGGAGAERADADLDAVMALFRAAEQYTDRTVGGGPAGFLQHLRSQDLPADTLAAQGLRGESVQVLTPAAAAGEEWQVVVVAGLQEDVWPDLRLRDSLLGAGALADLEAGRSPDGRRAHGPARRQVLDDELRMLAVAVSRATRRLLVTAVLDEEERPSSFVDLLAPDLDPTEVRAVPPALDLRGLVAQLRCAVEEEGSGAEAAGRRGEAAALLAHLAGEGVPGADPASWSGLAPMSSTQPLRAADEQVPVSPSGVEQATTCGLRWALEQAGGRGEASTDQSVGSLVHEIAAEHPHGTHAELAEALDARWAELGMGDGWVGRRQRDLAEKMIERLAGYVESVPGDVDVERDFAVDVGRAHLSGRMDRVEHLDDGEVRVVDLKTSANPVSAEKGEQHAQLGAYQLAVAEGTWEGHAPAGARLVYLGTGKGRATERRQPALDNAENPEWARELVTLAAETMAGAEFDAVQNDQCHHCPVRSSCPLQDNGGRVTQ
ncbi:ATP-dependent helicase [Georgenia subflava]|uniref:DNA 3'-5' helicase n=1 Tax=Georgenia subflava TaxID=1622177 RepID=A0A6N7EP09_9MICO|nr:ATP-dependent DNA helicase [Georgenia subflava]MPV38848.1 AAA family ATPase [Georgenia subflava]